MEGKEGEERGLPGHFSESDLHNKLAVVHGLLVNGAEGLLLVVVAVELNKTESLAA